MANSANSVAKNPEGEFALPSVTVGNDALSDQTVALACSGVSKVFPIADEGNVWRIFLGLPPRGKTFTALQDVSLTVPKGKIVGILGRNGAGKSTLLRVLGGVYHPTAGEIKAYGQICGLFELGGMGSNPNLTGFEYARRYLGLMGARGDELDALLADILDFSELGESFNRNLHTYSSGMGARLYFATATALQQEIYLIDELLSVGDEHFQAKCWHRMRERLLHGSSGILVTHDWSAILKLCENSHVIERGRIAHSGSSDKIVVSYLNLPVPDATVARFSPDSSDTYVAQSGEDSEFRFVIEIGKPAPVAFAYSIEMLRIGIGWEIILISDAVPVASTPGRHELVLTIPRLPIAPGQYSLNVFLSCQKANAQESAEGYDVRSWTLGNGWNLTVLGPSINSTTRLPISVGQWTDG